MKRILFCLYFLIISFAAFSQNEAANKAFVSVFYHIAVNVSSSHPLKAMNMADSLYDYSTTERQRLKSIMLKADILEKQEKRGEAILLAQQALKIAEQEKDYSFQARIYGFLSTQYRTIGFFDKGKESIKNGVAISFKIDKKDQVTKYRAMADEEMAEYAMEEKEYEKAIEYLQMAMLSYEKEDNEKFKYFLIGNKEGKLGLAFTVLNKIEKALEHYSRASININKAEAGNTLWAGSIYQGYANVLLKTENLDSAKVYILKALSIAENGNHGTLQQMVYKSTADYYQQANELDSFTKYNSKFSELLEKNSAKKKAMVNSAYKTLNENPEEGGETTSQSEILYISVGVLVLLSIFGYIVFIRRKSSLAQSEKISNGNDNKTSKLDLPKKTEDESLQKLNEFEASNDFLDKDMSSSVLTGMLHTNNKYLRQVLKKHKGKDYNNYINELRINYIVNKLKTDSEYLNYKISYLADESGFSSHSKFSADFRNIVGYSPSDFIDTLKKKS